MKYAIQFILFYYLIFSFNIYAQEEYIIEKYKKHEGYVYDVSFSPDQEKFISSSDDKTAIIWSLESKSPLYTLEKHYAEVRCAKFRHDGKYVVTGGDKSLVIWKNTGEYINTLTGHHTYIWTLDISKDNKYIVSGSFDNKFYLWDFNAVENLHVFEGHEKSVLVVCFSPNGKYIASGSLDKTIKIWNTETGENIITFPGHADNVYSLCFSQSGEYLLSASRDKTIKLWDVSSGKLVKTYRGHKNAVVKAIFTPDDQHILSASYDGTIGLWQLKTGKMIFSYIEHEGRVHSVDISQDGKTFLSCADDKSIIHWKLSPRVFLGEEYEKEIMKEVEESGLNEPKEKSESRSEYKERQDKLEEHLGKLLEINFQKYLDEQRDMPFIKE